jgi:exoribonuclease R
MKTYKIITNDRNYLDYTLYDISNFNTIIFDVNPIKNKLFNNDIFSIGDNNNISIIHSIIRCSPYISGVLITENDNYIIKNDIKYYKCFADDIRLPIFYIPYDVCFNKCIEKQNFLDDSKTIVLKNLYITFTYSEWNDLPCGKINQTIGAVDILNNFYEYKLYCKTLNSCINKFQDDTDEALIKFTPNEIIIDKIMEKYPNIENRNDFYIFTIDCDKSLDYDDAVGIKQISDDIVMFSIYISNVSIIIDILNLWDSFSKRISTIYLPDKKRPMIPSILCECLCSLLENHNRIVFTMDVYLKNDEIVDIKYSNCLIKVSKNYKYEEQDLLNNINYIHLFDTIKNLSKKHKYNGNMKTSHNLISYLMVFMNYYCATEMIKHKNGIYRSTILKRNIIIPDFIPDDVSKFIKNWYNSSGNYVNGSKEFDLSSYEISEELESNLININTNNNIRHALLNVDAYIHITSPNRRLVDLLNIIQFQENHNILVLSEKSKIFYKKWLNDLDYVNTTMNSIRKIQFDCSLIDLCNSDKELLMSDYEGFLFDKIYKNDGLIRYMVYIPALKLSSRINLKENFDNFEKQKFKIFIYTDNRYKKKIRLNLSL